MLAQLIEKVSGIKYEEFITTNIISTLGLQQNNLGFTINEDALNAKGYHKQFSFSNLILGLFIDKRKFMGKPEEKWRPFNAYYVNGSAYGGMMGNAAAFVKYIQGLLRPHCLCITDEFKNLLFTENHTVYNKPTGMCMPGLKAV